MSIAQDLITRAERRDVLFGIVGLGYVGLPLAVELADAGFRVLGFDVQQRVVDGVNAGRSHVKDVSDAQLQASVKAGRLSATTDMLRLAEPDAISICVPTPLSKFKDPDVSFIVAATESVKRTLRRGQAIILESTTYPGTTREILLPALESTGLTVGEDFFLAFSPEREDPGNPRYSARNIPKVVGGVGPHSARLAEALYRGGLDQVVRVSSARVAEAVKILENTYRAVNIALVNELKVTFDSMGIDIWEVIEAAKTKPFGFAAFYPGPGLGGHCIPIDPFYLTWKAREYGLSTRFIELAGEVNTAMPRYVVQRLTAALNEAGKCLLGARVLILGVAYKKDVADVRESPAVEIIEMLQQAGARVDYHDPYIPHLPRMRDHQLALKSVPLDDGLSRYDAAVVVTDHSKIDYAAVVSAISLVVDTRNACGRVPHASGRVVKA